MYLMMALIRKSVKKYLSHFPPLKTYRSRTPNSVAFKSETTRRHLYVNSKSQVSWPSTSTSMHRAEQSSLIEKQKESKKIDLKVAGPPRCLIAWLWGWRCQARRGLRLSVGSWGGRCLRSWCRSRWMRTCSR
jgi:hypothetical protein